MDPSAAAGGGGGGGGLLGTLIPLAIMIFMLVSMWKVFTKAGVPTSTYYRTIGGKTHLKYETAMKVAKIIAMLKEGRTLKRNDKRKL